MSTKALLFDLDGILVNGGPWHYKALNQALQKIAGTKIATKEHRETYNGLPTKTKLDCLEREGRIQPAMKGLIFDEKQIRTIEIIQRECEPNDRTDFIRTLSKKYKLGCVTNCIEETAKLMLTKTRILEFLGAVITNENTTRPKPDPDGYIIAMYLLGVKPAETLVVEDNEKGYIAARDAGVSRVLLIQDFDTMIKRVKEELKK